MLWPPLLAGAVPVYLGTSDVTAWIPAQETAIVLGAYACAWPLLGRGLRAARRAQHVGAVGAAHSVAARATLPAPAANLPGMDLAQLL